jgi:hypothetical protein
MSNTIFTHLTYMYYEWYVMINFYLSTSLNTVMVETKTNPNMIFAFDSFVQTSFSKEKDNSYIVKTCEDCENHF